MKKELSYLTLFIVFYICCDVSSLAQKKDISIKKNDRINLKLDTSEAEEVLIILRLRSEGQTIEDKQWQELFDTVPYRRLKERQEGIARRFHDSSLVLKDNDFKNFVLSDALLKRMNELNTTLEAWKKIDLRSAAEGILRYLPDSAIIRATVYPVIKLQKNSFVWDLSTNPAIFLYVNPEITSAKFENTVVHELHHIGLGSVNVKYHKMISVLPGNVQAVAEWAGAFGEGMAMLAAAGGPNVHPHAVSTESERTRWDSDMANYENNFKSVDSFFVNILSGKLSDQNEIEVKGSSFFGIQGPWYTVGYKMAVLVEKRFGRESLIQSMLDPRKLLFFYNRVAEEINSAGKEKLPLWSNLIIEEFGIN